MVFCNINQKKKETHETRELLFFRNFNIKSRIHLIIFFFNFKTIGDGLRISSERIKMRIEIRFGNAVSIIKLGWVGAKLGGEGGARFVHVRQVCRLLWLVGIANT